MATVIITDEQRSNLLCSAFETGGCKYWLSISPDTEKAISSVVKPNKNDAFTERLYRAVKAGARVPFRDLEDDQKLKQLTLTGIEAGERIMADKYPWHLSDIVSGNDDAITADVWFQCALLGDILYS